MAAPAGLARALANLALALLGAARLARGGYLLRGRAAAGQWPMSLSLTSPPPAPERPWRMRAEDDRWPRDQTRLRRRLHGRSQQFRDELRGGLGDDTPDSWFYRNYSKHGSGGLDGSYWDTICDVIANASKKDCGTNASNASNATASRPLDGWNVKNGTSCAEKDLLDAAPADEKEAEQACGGMCSSVLDVGCERKEFRLCKIGAREEPSPAGSCLRMRLPDHRPPEGKPRGPQELDFWRRLCSASTLNFRLVFTGRRCKFGKPLSGAYSEAACAELVDADPSCSAVFDFEEGPPPTCRCLPEGAECQAEPLEEGRAGGVFACSIRMPPPRPQEEEEP
mmetsp:Transcript_26487/g.81520  ORF Transcript_26487/g.81520 Transcript_26487/m.81520 type:complete len:338 (-) Transcript_26487:83-1096(-)